MALDMSTRGGRGVAYRRLPAEQATDGAVPRCRNWLGGVVALELGERQE